MVPSDEHCRFLCSDCDRPLLVGPDHALSPDRPEQTSSALSASSSAAAPDLAASPALIEADNDLDQCEALLKSAIAIGPGPARGSRRLGRLAGGWNFRIGRLTAGPLSTLHVAHGFGGIRWRSRRMRTPPQTRGCIGPGPGPPASTDKTWPRGPRRPDSTRSKRRNLLCNRHQVGSERPAAPGPCAPADDV